MITIDEKGVTLKGWVEGVRNLGGLAFITVRDINGTYQVTILKNKNPELFELGKSLRNESVIEVSGEKKENPKAINGYEIIPDHVILHTEAEQPVPLNLNKNVESSLDKDLDYRFLSLRKEKSSATFKIQSTVSNSIVRFFEAEGFYQIHSSKIVSQATEGGANVFPVVYFDRTAYLAQSPQFYKQMTMAAGFEKVFEIGPVFRAEPHHTSRHLCEYTSVDLEMSFIKSYEDIMEVMEKMIAHIYRDVEKHNVSEIYKGLGHDLYVFDFKTRSAYIITCSGKKFVKDVCSSSTSPKEDYRLLFNIAKGTFNPKSSDSYIGYN